MADPKVKHSHAHPSLLIVHSPTAIEESLHPTHSSTSLRWTNVAGVLKIVLQNNWK